MQCKVMVIIMALMGLDVGTSGCKSVVCLPDGTYISGAYTEYAAHRAAGAHELDADVMWDCIKEVITLASKECKEKTNGGERVEAITVTSFGEAGVPVDRDGRVLHGIVLYTDNRGEAETEALCRNAGGGDFLRGKKAIEDAVYMKPHSMYTLPKLMWYKSALPDIYEKIRHFLLIEDYAVYRLTGEARTSYSCAARSLAFDVVNKRWSNVALDAAGIDKAILSEPVPSGTPAGCVMPALCEELGLSPDTLVINGAHDQISAAIGAGALTPGTSVDGMGTVECITPVFDRPLSDPDLIDHGYVTAPHAIDGLYATCAFTYCGGALIQWFRDTVGKDAKAAAAAADTGAYKLLDAEILSDACAKTPTGILVLPHFAGAATPYMDTDAHGAVIGLSLETTRAAFYKAMMEGVTYEMRLNIEMLRRGNMNIEVLNAAGGGSRSEYWMQLKADITGLPVNTLANPEAGAVGCIMLGAIAKGYYKDLYEASEVLVKTKKTFLPDAENHKRYEEHFARYQRIYSAVKTVYGREGV